MSAFFAMTWIEFKLTLRDPWATFFTLAFPLLILFTFGSIFGNEPDPTSGRGAVDHSVPGYLAMIIGTTTLLGMPITLAAYREYGILRRYSATPISPLVILVAQACVFLLLIILGSALLLIAGRIFYGLVLPTQPLQLIGGYLLCCLSFLVVGFLLGGIVPTTRAAQAIGSVLFFPMLFLSGAAFPRMIMPEAVQRVSDFLPLTHVTLLLDSLWIKTEWQVVSLAVLTGILIGGSLVSMITFRWR